MSILSSNKEHFFQILGEVMSYWTSQAQNLLFNLSKQKISDIASYKLNLQITRKKIVDTKFIFSTKHSKLGCLHMQKLGIWHGFSYVAGPSSFKSMVDFMEKRTKTRIFSMNKEQFDQFSSEVCTHFRPHFQNTLRGNDIFWGFISFWGLNPKLCHVLLILSFPAGMELQIYSNFQQLS